MERDAYYKWRERMDAEEIRFFRRKNGDRPMEMLSSSWNGGTGMVNCNYVLDEKAKRYAADVRICFTKLEPLSDMEVIALAAT